MCGSELMADVLTSQAATCHPTPLATKSLRITVFTQTPAWIGRPGHGHISEFNSDSINSYKAVTGSIKGMGVVDTRGCADISVSLRGVVKSGGEAEQLVGSSY